MTLDSGQKEWLRKGIVRPDGQRELCYPLLLWCVHECGDPPFSSDQTQERYMPACTNRASTIQIPGSPIVSTPIMGLLWWHRALQPKGTVVDSPYLPFLSPASSHWFMLLWRWREKLPMQNTIIILHKPSSASIGRSLQRFLNYSSSTSNTICPRWNLTQNHSHHLPPSWQDAFCVTDHNYHPPHPWLTRMHQAVSHLTAFIYAVHLFARSVPSSFHLVPIKTKLSS